MIPMTAQEGRRPPAPSCTSAQPASHVPHCHLFLSPRPTSPPNIAYENLPYLPAPFHASPNASGVRNLPYLPAPFHVSPNASGVRQRSSLASSAACCSSLSRASATSCSMRSISRAITRSGELSRSAGLRSWWATGAYSLTRVVLLADSAGAGSSCRSSSSSRSGSSTWSLGGTFGRRRIVRGGETSPRPRRPIVSSSNPRTFQDNHLPEKKNSLCLCVLHVRHACTGTAQQGE